MTETALELQRDRIAITTEQMTLARATVAKGLNDDEFAMYLYNCQRQGIHPLDGLLIPIVRNDNESGSKRLTFVTTVDLLRSRAAETNEYAGSDDAIFDYLDGAGNPQSATVTVWRIVQGMKCAFTATARWGEYYPGEKQGFMWRNKPHVMLGKCAEGLALRKAFPKQLAGLYLEEELQKESTPGASKTAKKAQQPVGDVLCAHCRAINGHLPSCITRKENAAPAQAAPTAQPASQPSSTPIQTVEPAVEAGNRIPVKITKVIKRTVKPFRRIEVLTNDGTVEMSVWHEHFHPILDKLQTVINDGSKQMGMALIEYSTKDKDGKTWTSLERIIELDGVPLEEDKEEF